MFRSVHSGRVFAILTVVLFAASACNRVQDVPVQPEPGTNDQAAPEAAAPEAAIPPKDNVGDTDDGTAETVADENQTPAGELTIGDMAPTLEIGQWVKGQQVDGFQNGHVYVVEFWATWCGPCRAGMPHISQLQERFIDRVTFIGVSAEDEPTVRSFLGRVQNPDNGETWDQVVKYTIALDSNGATNAAYMEAANQRGIPAAFVVGKDGHVEWIGHPMRIDEPLERIVAGTWDREAARAEFAEKQAAEAAYMAVAGALRTAEQDGDWTKALEALDGAIEQFPAQNQFRLMKFSALLKAEEIDSARTLAEEIAKENWDNARLLNQIAWVMATGTAKSQQSLESALRIARQASSLGNDEDAMILDTVARVYYEQGNLKEAVTWQRKAVEHDSSGRGSIKEVLQKYEAELGGRDGETPAGRVSKSDGEASETDGEASETDGEASETDSDANAAENEGNAREQSTQE